MPLLVGTIGLSHGSGVSGPLGTSGKEFQANCGNRSLLTVDRVGDEEREGTFLGSLFVEVVESCRLFVLCFREMACGITECCTVVSLNLDMEPSRCTSAEARWEQ